MIKTRCMGEWFEIIIPSQWSDIPVDTLLRDMWKIPKKQLHLMKMDKSITLNGQLPQWNRELTEGDKLQLRFFTEEEYGLPPSYYDVNVLFEDEHLLVLNKPANMSTHPNTPEQTDTLINAAAFHLEANGEKRMIKHIHRLDKDTTGAVLFAKHSVAGSILDKMLEERSIKRTYLALVHGIVKQKKGKIDLAIGRDRHHPTRRRVSAGGQSAVTNYSLEKTYPDLKMSLVKCLLDTGRTHQIRVQMSHLGHPLVGDLLYGGKPVVKRQALHAVKLEFNHPFTNEKIICHAPFLDEPPIFKNIDPFTF